MLRATQHEPVFGRCICCNRENVKLYYCGGCGQQSCGYCCSRIIDITYTGLQAFGNPAQKRICEYCYTKSTIPTPQEILAAKKKTFEEDITKSVLANNLVMLNDSTFSDFKFIFINEDKELNAHKVILAAASPVFHRMFTTDMEEARTNTCNVEEFAFEIFEHFLRFVYGGKLPENIEDIAVELFKTAHYYEIEQLKKICEAYMLSSLNVTNSIKIHECAFRYDLADILTSAWNIVKRWVS